MKSVEAGWQAEATRRKRLRMWLVVITMVFVVFLVVAWAVVTQPILTSARSAISVASVDTARLQAHVLMLSQQLVPRDSEHPENLDRVAAYIREQFVAAKANVSEQPYQVNGKTYRNVIALFGPDSKERIVVGAHYDSAGEFPAADDNASGVAGLIELAYLLGNAQLPMRVELVAYSLEEPKYFGTEHMGSAIHAALLKRQGVSLRAMLSLEMIGYFSDAPDSQHFPSSLLKSFYPSQGNFITVVGKLGQGSLVRRVKRAMRAATPLPVYSINAPQSLPGIDFSDHLNYWNEGYQAVMISDTAFYRNHRYHTAEDTANTLDYQRMAMVVQGVYVAVQMLAEP
ncbi:MAG: M28 family peptidase [Acidobacteriota bacterium]